MVIKRNRLFLMKWISLFSTIRVYNIIVLIVAQYLASIFILSNEKPMKVLFDTELLILVLASSLSIASGYIINNFYDSQKDLINRPKKTLLDRLVSQKTKLTVYFGINFFVILLSFLISWRAVLFFSVYIFLIWFYSHKVKKYTFLGNLYASLLAVIPFFAILLYYKNFHEIIFVHAFLVYLLILIRELMKDLVNISGDFTQGYQTVPVAYGERKAKKLITGFSILTLVPMYILTHFSSVGLLYFYFYSAFFMLVFIIVVLWNTEQRKHYLLVYNVLKTLILVGVLSVALINPKIIDTFEKLLCIH
uniref:geranylgeranylglycerol-phosphate geranylgeranyltransferase n=1 Tax=Flavobacterium sp. TaxID=239 RepID=UPI00404A7A38